MQDHWVKCSIFFYRIEFQQRGSPHAHGGVWIKDAPDPETSDAATTCAFVDQYVHAVLPFERS